MKGEGRVRENEGNDDTDTVKEKNAASFVSSYFLGGKTKES